LGSVKVNIKFANFEDLYKVLSQAPNEVPALLKAVRDGRIDGSVYEGPCCCLKGTLAAACGKKPRDVFEVDSTSPAEALFLPIKPGMTPENSSLVAEIERRIVTWMNDRGMKLSGGEA
jgi:hypothetical protein